MQNILSSLKKIGLMLLKFYRGAAIALGSLVIFGILLIVIAARSANVSGVTPPTQKVIREHGADKVALVYLNGQISEDSGESSFAPTGIITPKKINQVFDYLELDTEIKAVVLRINSPGGTVVASDEIAQRVKQLKNYKPVVSSLGDTAASGGYYIAAHSNKIMANSATITGSIGVIAQFPKLSGLYEKIGMEMRTFKSGEFKDIGSSDRDLTKEEEVILNSIISDSYDQFVEVVASGRKMDLATVKKLADGRIYTGKQAVENGLVDQLGSLDDAILLAENLAGVKDATVVEFSSASFWESILESTSFFSPLQSIDKVLPSGAGVYYLWGM